MECEICGELSNISKISGHPTLNCSSCQYYKTVEDEETSKELKEKYKGDFWSQEKLEDMIDTNFSNKQGRDYKLTQESMYAYSKQFIPEKGRILEIGVGTGVHLLNFDKLGYDVTGIEPDPISTEFLNKNLKNGKCINGYIEDLNFNEKFDVKNDPDSVEIDFIESRVSDHSALEAILNIVEKYELAGKSIHLKHLSEECKLLLYKSNPKFREVIIEAVDDPRYHLAADPESFPKGLFE